LAQPLNPEVNVGSASSPGFVPWYRWSRCSRWMRLVFSFPSALASVLVATVFAFGRNGLSDPDIWFHLNIAENLLTHHRVPRVEAYSFTAGGLPWINPEYLAEVPYYLAWRLSGVAGIKMVSLVLLEAIFLGLLYLCWQESGNPKASVLACCFVVPLAAVSFGPRTVLAGYLYLVLLLIVLQRFRLRGSAPIWVLPPLFCCWINTHGSWSLGLLVFGIIVASGLVQGQWRSIEATRWSPPQLRSLLTTLVASTFALFANPYGYRLVLYPLDLAIRQRIAIANVMEWASVDFHDARGKVVILLIVGLLLGALLSGHRWKLHELGLVLFGLYSGLTHIRFLFLAALLIAPLLAKFLDFVPPYDPKIDKPVLNALIMAGVLLFLVRGFPSSSQLQQSIEADYPAEVLPYLKSHPPAGPVMNYYLWGGYLCWYDRDFKEFIDSRADIFVYAGVFQDYVTLMGLNDSAAILDKYGIRYVLFPPHQALTYILEHDPKWKVAFRGKMSLILERVGAAPAPLVHRPELSGSMYAW
jgi:hypothetical protein